MSFMILHDITSESNMEIRQFQPTDANEVSEVIRRALALININDYPKHNIKLMIEYFTPQTILELARIRSMYVLMIDSKIVATGSLQNDTIYSLFVDPEHIGKGLGTKLMKKLEALARHNHVTTLKVPSSITAVGFYIRLGFVKEKEVFSQKTGLTIHMTKQLSKPGF
jgi:ribosomal protein S18 acetylase RimI-like enzyme